MIRSLILGLLLQLFAANCVLARQSVDFSNDEISAKQWEVTDIHFNVADLPRLPVEVEFSASFAGENGESFVAPGFYDGAKDFVVRFTPPSSGKWTFRTVSSIAELNGKSGRLSISGANAGQRGAVRLDPNHPRRFIHENGEPYFPIAFEADWLFALDAENEADIPTTRRLVDTLAASGFNQVVMNVFAYDVNWRKDPALNPEYDFGSPRAFPFLGTNTDPDFSDLNIDFFQRLDRVIDYLDQKNIVSHLMIYVWNKRVAWPEANSKADNRYFDYVARRYQAYPNLVWDISKEALGYGHTDVNYITDRIQRLRKIDAYDRLITVHDYGYCRRFPDEVDFVSVQLWSSELHSVMRNVLKAIPGKPILNIEHGGYERGPYVVFNGNYTSPEVCLERAYQCVFAGTYPTHYWQGAAWNVIIPDVLVLEEEERPRLEYYRHLRDFVDRFHVHQLTAGDKKSNAGFSLHDGKNLILYYVPKECDFLGLRLPKDRAEVMQLTWFDPFTGEYTEPIQREIPKWPTVEVPAGKKFRILICELNPKH